MNKWDERFLQLAEHISHWSKDNKHVGAVIVNEHHKILSTGYNGLPAHMEDRCLDCIDSADKGLLVTHAEENALQMLSEHCYHHKLTIYITKPPCKLCTIYMIHSRANIERVVFYAFDDPVFMAKYNVEASLALLDEHNIQWEMVER